jgi:hypothetical protein
MKVRVPEGEILLSGRRRMIQMNIAYDVSLEMWTGKNI